MKSILKWLFKYEWEQFEHEMRQLEWEHYLSHKHEIEEKDKLIQSLFEQVRQLKLNKISNIQIK